MKRIGMTFAALAAAPALLLALGGCTSSSKDTAADTRFVGQWVLASARDAGGTIDLRGTYITLTINPSEAATGRGACNDYTANIIGEPGAVFVHIVHRTLGLCSDVILAQLDQRYINALKASSLASVDGEYLTLASKNSSLLFHKVAHFMIGGIVDIPWLATNETFHDENGDSYSATPAGLFTLKRNKTFTMNVGACPNITGTWQMDAGEILLENLKGTDAACYTPDDSANRNAVMSVLANGFQASTRNGTLNTVNPRTLAGITFQHADLD